jgi:hypothetical protein
MDAPPDAENPVSPKRAFDWKALCQKTWVIVLSGLVIPPVGIILTWLKPGWATRTKWIATGLMCLLLVGRISSSSGTNDEVSDTTAQSADTLTADYFPFKTGARANFDKTIARDSVFHFHWDFQPGGVIAITLRSMSDGDGHHKFVNKQTMSYKYRKNGSFIEIGDETEHIGFVWQPLVKIGARVGDSWESAKQHGVRHRYTLVDIEPDDRFTKSPMTAAIVDECEVDGKKVTQTTWQLANRLWKKSASQPGRGR